MASFKLKGKVVKIYDGEVYTFVSGRAIVPGCWFKGKQMTITLEEFNSLKREI